MILANLGFISRYEEAFRSLGLKEAVPGRIIWQSAYSYRVQCEAGEYPAKPTGKVKTADLPAVGDWVAVAGTESGGEASILAVLPRHSAFSRNAAGKTVSEQVVAANIDEVFIVTDLQNDLNLRRIERYITLVYNSGANPVVVLNKADRSLDVDTHLREAQAVSPGVPVFAVSASEGQGIDRLEARLHRGKTVAFLGSSGVGKSTLINRILGDERLVTAQVREADGKGRHTTTYRELLLLPGGGAVIDTPGMREIRVWGDEQGLSGAFPEIEDLASMCRFRDCRHEGEVGCAVAHGLDSGTVDPDRLESYKKLRGEFESLRTRRGERARMLERREGKRFARMVKEVNRHNPKRKR